LSFNLSN